MQNPVIQAIEFERELKVGATCLARWTLCGGFYQARVEVVSINPKSFGVRLLDNHNGYRAGQRLNIPNFLNYERWSVNNRLAPLG